MSRTIPRRADGCLGPYDPAAGETTPAGARSHSPPDFAAAGYSSSRMRWASLSPT